MNEDHYLVELDGVKRFMPFNQVVTVIACGRKCKFMRYILEKGDEMNVRPFDLSARKKIKNLAILKRGDLLRRSKK